MRTVTQAAVAAEEQSFENLPGQVREALGELAGQAKEELLALSVGVGLDHQSPPRQTRQPVALADRAVGSSCDRRRVARPGM
jgi:hypothetical protein